MAQSQNEKNTAWYKAFAKLEHGIVTNMECAFIAKVVKYNASEHTADILPLVKSSSGEISAQYLDVPVTENCYILDEIFERLKSDFSATDANSKIGAHDGVPAHTNSKFVSHLPKHHLMREGVPVICVNLDRDLDNWKGGRSVEPFMPNSSRTHDANDAIIVGVLGGDATNG